MINKKQNFISVDGKTARSSYGEYFIVGETVKHEDSTVQSAVILSFEFDKDQNEIKVITDKGYSHLDFLVKES